MYVPIDHFNVCQKIVGRLRDFLVKYKPSSMGVRKFAVLVGNGSFNPLTRMHLRSYFVAKQYLEAKSGYIVLGSLLSPAHGISVRERYRTNQSEILPSTHRLAIAQLLVQSSKWLHRPMGNDAPATDGLPVIAATRGRSAQDTISRHRH